MKTKKQVLAERAAHRILINAVIKRVGMDAIKDINNHGIDGGYNGFIYYSDTHAFAMKYRKQINILLHEEAEDMGEDVVIMVSNFGVFGNSPMEQLDKQDLYNYLSNGGKCEQGTITNVMAWFAAEEVCRMFEE